MCFFSIICVSSFFFSWDIIDIQLCRGFRYTSWSPQSYLSFWVWVFFFHMPYLSELIQYFSFCISFHVAPSRSIHVIANGRIFFFSWLNIIPLYIGTTSSVSIHLLMDTSMSWLCNQGSVFTQVSVRFLLNHCPANQAGLPNQHPGGADQGLDGAVQ